jgi:exosortase
MTELTALHHSRQEVEAAAWPDPRWRDLGRGHWLRIGLVALLFLLLFRYELVRMVTQWRTHPSWSHGFLIPVFSLYFVHQQRHRILSSRYRTRMSGLVLLVLAIVIYAFNTVSPSGYAYVRALAMLVALVAVVWLLGGGRLLRWTWLPIVYLLFAVPLPQRLYVALTLPLRRGAAVVAAALLDACPGLETSVQGVVIDIVYRGQRLEPALNVAEACSGMRLLVAFLALGVAMAALHPRPLAQRLGLLVATIPIAILCNIVRVTVTGFLYVFAHPRYTQGLYHDALGFAMLPLAFLMLGAVAWFMRSLYEPAAPRDEEAAVVYRRGDGR